MELHHVHDLSRILDDLALKLDDTRYSDELYKYLRMDIIHGQICLANYFNWKQDLTKKQETEGKSLFEEIVLEDENMLKVKK